MQDITNHAPINVFKVVFVNVVMLEEIIQKVNVFLIGDVNDYVFIKKTLYSVNYLSE